MSLTFECTLPDAEATERAGEVLSQCLRDRVGGVLFLRGDLGAGKTTLARGLLRALGVSGPVRSPSYTLIEPYTLAGRTILHMDLYRLRDPEELEGLGLRDFPTSQTWWLVEWPEHGGTQLPAPQLDVSLGIDGGGRRLRIDAEQGMAPVIESVFQALGRICGEQREYLP